MDKNIQENSTDSIAMHVQEKMGEAHYFFEKIKLYAEAEDRNGIVYNISAFLCSSRSILQYIHRSVKNNKDSKIWYEKIVNRHAIIKQFRDLRDTSIHERQIKIPAIHYASIGSCTGLSEETHPISNTKNEILEQNKPNTPNENNTSLSREGELKTEYYFERAGNGKDIITLCDEYLDVLISIVSEWRSLSGITATHQ